MGPPHLAPSECGDKHLAQPGPTVCPEPVQQPRTFISPHFESLVSERLLKKIHLKVGGRRRRGELYRARDSLRKGLGGSEWDSALGDPSWRRVPMDPETGYGWKTERPHED